MRTIVLFLALMVSPVPVTATPNKTIQLEVSGDTILVIQSLPVKVTAKAGADFYLWNVPDDVKTSNEDNVLTVTNAPKGKTTISVVAVTIEFTVDKDGKVTKKVTKDKGSIVLTIGIEPTPPTPPKPPEPPTPPAPIPADGLRVLIVYESSEQGKMPKEQQAILRSMPFRTFLNSVCTDDPQSGTKKAWWMLDKDEDVSGLSKLWQDAMKVKRDSLPWIIVSNGKTGYSGPLPANVDEVTALVKKYEVK